MKCGSIVPIASSGPSSSAGLEAVSQQKSDLHLVERHELLQCPSDDDGQHQPYADDVYGVRQACCDSMVVSMAFIDAAGAGCEMKSVNL